VEEEGAIVLSRAGKARGVGKGEGRGAEDKGKMTSGG